MYKMVAIDLDGTLLNSQKQVSAVNKNTILQAIGRGVKIVICSGRIFAGAKIFARQLRIREPLITCNGALIKDMETGEKLYSSFLTREDCCRIIDICRKADIYYHIYMGDAMYAERLEFSALFYATRNRELPEKDRVDVRVAEHMEEIILSSQVAASKFVVISEDAGLLSEVRSEIGKIPSVDIMSSYYNNFEIVNRGVNKGNAVKFIADRLEIHKNEIIAIGDNENDYSMISYAGLGVAMGNAEKAIKEIADYITATNDEDGVSETIQRFVL